MTPVDPLEVLEGRELDDDLAARAAHRDLDPGLEVVAEQLLELEQTGRAEPSAAPVAVAAARASAAAARRSAWCSRIASSTARTERSSATTRLASCSWNARSGVPSSARAWPIDERAVLQRALDRRRQLQQPQRVGDRGPALADPGRDLVVGEREVLDELLVGGGLLERVELLAVDVLDERLLERGGVVGRRGRAPGSSGARPGGPRASAARRRSARSRRRRRAHEDRLEHADLADRLGERAPAPPRRSARAAVDGFGRIDASGISCEPDLVARDDARSGSAHRAPYPVRRVAPRLTSFASSRYADAPRETSSRTR